MSVPRRLRRLLWLAAGALALALIGLIVLIVPSADNAPYMTPFAVTLVALVTALVLLGVLGGLAERDAAAPPCQEESGRVGYDCLAPPRAGPRSSAG